ncbi:MAG TPA: hypothetical protein VF491_13365, partial [Vicinamibacterales bacterium]
STTGVPVPCNPTVGNLAGEYYGNANPTVSGSSGTRYFLNNTHGTINSDVTGAIVGVGTGTPTSPATAAPIQ